jgi:hypothetical protein
MFVLKFEKERTFPSTGNEEQSLAVLAYYGLNESD